MEQKGLVFDIKEFAVFDGPGIRTTVFLKGCPLRCQWCHNPEGLSFHRELMISKNGCLHCGRCEKSCIYGGYKNCRLCGKCVLACPLHLRKICGQEYTSQELVRRLRKDEEFLKKNNGGVTFSGGEAFAQPSFLKEVLLKLPDMHKAVETSGYCSPVLFRELTDLLELVIMDIKLADEELHRFYTGVSNSQILENLAYLKQGKKPFIIRVPLIPGVNDTDDNLKLTAELLADARGLQCVELLPYHTTAGAKYDMVGREYRPAFDTMGNIHENVGVFQDHGIPCRVL